MTKGTEINYGEESFAVSGVAFVDWEDQLEQIDNLVAVADGEKELAKEWITYHTLINEGFFVSKPSLPEPELSKAFTEPETSGDDGIFDAPTHEPAWTQSRILAERDKLLREREKLQKAKEEAFDRKVLEREERKRESAPNTLYHEDGTPYSLTDVIAVVGILGVILYLVSVPIILVLIICAICIWGIRKAS